MTYETQITINAPVAKVWEALITPEITRQYMYGCDVISDWRIGSSVAWKGAADAVIYVIGDLVAFEPNQLLSFTVFDPHGKYENIPENYLTSTYQLSAVGGQTLVKVSQGDYAKVEDGEKRFQDSVSGWNATLEALKKILEG